MKDFSFIIRSLMKSYLHTSSLQQEIFTSRKHGMDYFTVDGLVLRTGYKNKRDWYLLPIREMLDNDADFLWEYYKGANKNVIYFSQYVMIIMNYSI